MLANLRRNGAKNVFLLAAGVFFLPHITFGQFQIPDKRYNPWDPVRRVFDYGLEDDLELLKKYPQYPMTYCKLGNRLSVVKPSKSTFTLNYPAHLISDPAAMLFMVAVNSVNNNADLFEPTLISYDDGLVTVTEPSESRLLNKTFFLYKKFSFPQVLVDLKQGGTVNPTTRKLVILIHGWNPPDPVNFFISESSNPFAGDEWLALEQKLLSKLPAGWGLSEYNWASDAATGPVVDFDGSSGRINGVEAAEIGHSHGRHLGELLRQNAPNLQKVHFIAHSAGSWVARTAATYLLSNMPNVQIQVTLLDPFMPAQSGDPSSALGKNIINNLARRGVDNWSIDRLFRLENYYAVDTFVPGTQEIFEWRDPSVDYNFQVDFTAKYGGHSGPIQYYADSVADRVPYRSDAAHLLAMGWHKSTAWHEMNKMPTPILLPAMKTGPAPLTVEISSINSDYADIYYTTDGSTPTKSSSLYTGPITITSTKTITAIAFQKSGVVPIVDPSDSVSGTYTITDAGTLPPPDFSPGAGTYQAPLDVAILGASGATVRYTTTGADPTESSPAFTGPVRLTQTMTLKAKAFKSGYSPSIVQSASYTLSNYGTLPAITAINTGNIVTGSLARQWFTITGSGFMSGFTASFRDELNSVDYPVINDPNRLLSDSVSQVRVSAGVGTDPGTWSVRINNPNGSSSAKAYFIVIQPGSSSTAVAAPAFSHSSGTYVSPFTVTMQTATAGAEIRFTTDGSAPTEASQLYQVPIPVSASMILKAKAFKYGFLPSELQSASYTLSAPLSGSLRVTLSPAVAVSAGALWRVSGGAWHQSGETATGISAGNAVVVFNSVPGWIAPLARLVTITTGQTTYDDAPYTTENTAPNTPADPYPVHGAGNIQRMDTTLSWTGGDAEGGVEYALKFGTDPNPPFYAGFGSINGTSFTLPLTLQGGVTYYWGVRAKDAQGLITDSPVWSFTTEYSYSDLIPINLNLSGTVGPGSNITVSVNVRNTGTFVCPSAYVRFYLSRAAGAKEIQLTPGIAPPTRIDAIEPGQVRTVTFTVPLAGLQAGRSYIDAWIDSGPPGPFNENNFGNNLLSLEINYTDASAPEVTWAQLGQGGFIRTAYTNLILYAARDDTGIKTIDFLYSTNGGINWTAIQTNYIPPRNCTYGDWYDWFIPTTIPVTSNFYIKVVAKDSTGNAGSKAAGPYWLRDGVAPAAQIISPNGGEVLDMGSQCEVRWSAAAPNGVYRMVLWFYYGDTALKVADVTTNQSGSINWILPAFSTTSGRLLLEVTDNNGNVSQDWSDGFFAIRDRSAPPQQPWGIPSSITSVPTNPVSGAKDNSSPSLAVDVAGTVHLAYLYSQTTSVDPLINTQTIYYKKYSGGAWSLPAVVYTLDQPVNTGPYGLSQLKIAVSEQGLPSVVWQTHHNSSGSNVDFNHNDIFFTRLNGTSWTVPENISQSVVHGLTNTVSRRPAMTIDSFGVAHVVWSDGQSWQYVGDSDISTGVSRIYYRSKSASQAWSDISMIMTNSGDFPQIQIDHNGVVNLICLAANGTSSKAITHLKLFDGQWTLVAQFTNMLNTADSLDFATKDAGQLDLIWKWYNSVSKTRYTYYSTFNGNEWGDQKQVFPMSLSSCAVCVDSQGRPHVVGCDAGALGALIYSTLNAATWTTPVSLHSLSQAPSGNTFDAVMLPASNFMHVVWASYQNGHTELLHNFADVSATNDIYAPSVGVTRPFAGQCLSSGHSFNIEWSAVDGSSVGIVDIHYTTDGGASWQIIATNRSNSGTHLWVVPNLGTNAGEVRVTARDPSGNAGMGYSGQFTTADLNPPTVAILSPAAGATLTGNSIINIQWNALDNVAVTELAMEYSMDNGKAWAEISRGLSNTNTLAWQLPNIATTGLLLRATAYDAVGFSTSYTAAQSMTIVRTNNPPAQPNSPFPLATSEEVPIASPYLHWSSEDIDGDLIVYQVRFGKVPSPEAVYSGAENYLALGLLDLQTTYYWQIIASDGKTNVSSPVWSFTTVKAYYALTVSGGTGGGTAYTNQQQVKISANPPAVGKAFDRWAGDTQYVADETSATTTVMMPSGPVSLSAEYRAIFYTLTASASGKGRIEPSGEIQIEHGATQIFTAVPDAGYQVKHWLAGSDVVAEGQSTLSVIAEGDRTVSVVFEAGVPLSSWLVFEGRSQRQRLDESGGKRGEPVVLKETLSTLLVVNRDRPGQTNAVLVSWGKSGVQTQAVVAVSMDDSYPVSAKNDKAGRPAAERNLWALSLRDNTARSLLIGTFDGAYRYDKAGVLLRVQQRASLNGAGLSPEDPSFSAGLLRLNQIAGDALNKQDGDFDEMAAALRAQIKKLPAEVIPETLSELLQNAAGE